MTVVKRSEKGSRLSFTEMDANFQVLRGLEQSFTSFTTRASLVSGLSALSLTDGAIVIANGLAYKYSTGATYLPNLTNLIPAGNAMGEHFGMEAGASDNTAALQAACTWSGATGEFVTITAGTYNCLTTIIPVSYMKIRGVGMDKTIITQALTNFASLFSVGVSNSVSNVYMSDMTLNGQALSRTTTGTAGHLFAAYAFDTITFERMKFKEGLGYGIGLQGYPAGGAGKTGPQNEAFLHDCIIEYCGHGKFKETTLSGGITSSDTTITVADGTQLDASGGTMMIGSEIIRYGIVTGGTTSVVRGVAGTTAASHSNGDTVYRLSNGDGMDTKSGFRYHLENVISRYNGDNGLNIRCHYASLVGCKTYGNVGPGIGLNSNTSQSVADTSTTLATTVTSSDTSIVLTDASAFAASGVGRFDSENFSWSGKSVNTLTGVVRGLYGTVAVAHTSGVTVSVDPLDDSSDTVITLDSCHSWSNTSAGYSVAGSSAASASQVNFTNCVSEKNSGGLNVSGGSYGATGGRGQLAVTVTGGSFSKNTNAGITVTNVEEFTATGCRIYKNGTEGVYLVDQVNGATLSNVNYRANGNYAIREGGITDNCVYSGGRMSGNTNKVILQGANSRVRNISGYVNEQYVVSGSIAVDSIGNKSITVGLAMDVFDLNKCSITLIKDGTDYNDYVFKTPPKLQSGSTSTINANVYVATASATVGATVKFGIIARG